MELRDISAVVRLADYASFNRAASHLAVDASTLSRRVQRFEEELGVLVFERGHHRVVPTSGGLELIRLARRIVDDLDALKSGAKKAGHAQMGSLRLATQVPITGQKMSKALRVYRSTHPDIVIDLTEGSDSDLVEGLNNSLFDVAFMLTPLVGTSLETLQLWQESLVVAVPEAHTLADRHAVSWNQIREEPILVQGWQNSDALRLLEVALLGVGTNFRAHRASCSALLGLVALGDGVLLTLASHCETYPPGVRIISINEPDAVIGISLVWPRQIESPISGSFVAAMRDFKIVDVAPS